MPQPAPSPVPAATCPHLPEGGWSPLRGAPRVHPRPYPPVALLDGEPPICRASLAEATPEQSANMAHHGDSWSRPSKGPTSTQDWGPGPSWWAPASLRATGSCPSPACPPGLLPGHAGQTARSFKGTHFLPAPRIAWGWDANAGPGRPPQSLGRGRPPVLWAGHLLRATLRHAICPLWSSLPPAQVRQAEGCQAELAASWWPQGRQSRAPGAGAQACCPQEPPEAGGQGARRRVRRPPGHQESSCGGSEGLLKYSIQVVRAYLLLLWAGLCPGCGIIHPVPAHTQGRPPSLLPSTSLGLGSCRASSQQTARSRIPTSPIQHPQHEVQWGLPEAQIA